MVLIEKNRDSKPDFDLGDYLFLGLKGIYRVVEKTELLVGTVTQPCLVLESVFTRSIHKTFVPLSQLKQIENRYLVDELILNQLPKFIADIKTNPVDITLNSNKKILHYEKTIYEKGFLGLIESYFNIKADLEINGKPDKRYIAHADRLKELIIQEVSIVKKINYEKAQEFFEMLEKSHTTH